MGVKEIVFGILVTAVFALAILSFNSSLSNDNNSLDISSTPELANYTSQLRSNITSYSDSASSTYGGFTNSTVETLFNNLGLGWVTKGWTTIITTPINIYKLIVHSISFTLFGDDSFVWVVDLVSAIIFILVIFYVWKWIRLGDPD